MGIARGIATVGLAAACAAGICADAITSGSAAIGKNPNQLVPERIAVSGKVIDEEGKPMPDVDITVSVNYKQESRLDGLRGEFGTAVSDSAGSFTLQMGKGSEALVAAYAEDHVVGYAIWKAPGDKIDLVLKKDGRSLGGTVVDAAGKPVPNAVVGLAANTREISDISHRPLRLGLHRASLLKVKADAEGNFLINDLPGLPVIVSAADAAETRSLTQDYRLSNKKPTLDLAKGDILGYLVEIDEPAESRQDRIREHQDRIQRIIEESRARRAGEKTTGTLLSYKSDRTTPSIGSPDERIQEHSERIKIIIEESQARRAAGKTSGSLDATPRVE